MTNVALQKELAAMKADIRELKKSVKVNSAVEKARARLRAEILKGMASGPGKPIDASYWKQLHALAKRHAAKA
ncbi:MAG: hypothetical protein A2854_03525 [Parcubacteria group bacterium RIFCSPHIGHO2_01_FULL_56_18]|nr:MAG: hypothetical protein A2854_03525 [Parcubacteria group bacterium RIFCSPHIGHO2_01_FULL_56_18]